MTQQTDDSQKITRFNFTHALEGGAWIERANGLRDWIIFGTLEREMGTAWLIAMMQKQGWMTGCWINCEEAR